jgi:hypothetical protein
MIVGVSSELEAQLRGKYSQDEIDRFFNPHAHFGELRLVYARNSETTDRTSPMPSSRHMQYVSKGWTAVELFEEAVSAATPVIDVPAEIRQYAEGDKVGIWKRANAQIESSCRNALSLLSKGYEFVGLADEARLRAIGEARPWPPAARNEKSELKSEPVAPASKRR